MAECTEGTLALQSALDAAKKEVGTLRADYDTEFSRLCRDKYELQAALGALKKEADESKRNLSVGVSDFKKWMTENSLNMDSDALTLVADSNLETSSSNIHHALAYNALVAARSENWDSAYEDAEKSIIAEPSTMGYIAKALAHTAKGQPEKAMEVFDLAFGNCNADESNLLLLIKAIVLFVSRQYDVAISRVHDLIAVSRDEGAIYCYTQTLGKMYLIRGDYAHAVKLLERGQGLASSSSRRDLETISLISGWTFDGLWTAAQQRRCEDLYALDRTDKAAEILLKLLNPEKSENNVTAEWFLDLGAKCVRELKSRGDMALTSGEYDNAIECYTSALSLNLSNPTDILIKRSRARASKELWADALTDANEAIKRNPSSHEAYERKFAALLGAEDYGEANNALLHLLSILENSPDEGLRRLRANYTAPREIVAAIDSAILEIFSHCPLVLIDVTTGRLCNARERVRMFKSETPFKKLVSETAVKHTDHAYIRQSVAKYFRWTMFSHTWEGEEPTFKDVNVVNSVWTLDGSPLNEKLRRFCTTAREDGGRWVWSDTCCIDKTTSAILSQSITAMYRWYAEAEETLVYLSDVLSSAEPGALTRSRWMTRAWTLQELLASKVIRFYTRDWKLYLDDKHTNHKESASIKQELAQAMGVAPETIISFRPEHLGVREKLRLASTRSATVEEDIAYSLIGIFSSDIVPRYGLGKTAIGHLLENIVAQTGDVTVVAWTGKSLPYNSALPASLATYGQSPYGPSSIDANEIDMRVRQLRTHLEPQVTLSFYYQIIRLPRATFSNRRLQLPCIVFSVVKLGVQELGGSQGNLYRATVLLLGKVEFRTKDAMPLTMPRKLVFVHPWLRDLRDPLDTSASDDEWEAESGVGTGDASDAEEAYSESSGANSGDSVGGPSTPASPLHAKPSARVDPITQAMQLMARLERPFNALLLERQSNGQYKRVAAEHEIIVPGLPSQADPRNIRAKVLEIV